MPVVFGAFAQAWLWLTDRPRGARRPERCVGYNCGTAGCRRDESAKKVDAAAS
jgi:hypothetical protein